MNEEKKKILDRINELIDKRKEDLLSRFPHIHEIDDGIIIRFFTNWENCQTNEDVKYVKIFNKQDSDDITILHFIPKGTKLDYNRYEYVHSVLCVSGKIEIGIDSESFIIEANEKLYLPTNEFEAYAHDDSYVITQNK